MIDFIARFWDVYLLGLGVSFIVSIGTIVISISVGTLIALGRRSTSRILSTISSIYVAVFRAVPPLLALYIVYFGLPTWAMRTGSEVIYRLFSPLDNRIIAATIALAFVSSAYSSEIIRAAMSSVPDTQLEAARSIGMTYALAFRRVIAPQAARIAFPPLGNEYIGVLKSTSLASVIGLVELMRAAQIAAGATFQNLLAYSMAGAYYIVFVIILQTILTRIERRFPGGSVRNQKRVLSLDRSVTQSSGN